MTPDKNGHLNLLPDTAAMHGKVKAEGQGNNRNIGFWDNAQDWVSWDKVKITRPGRYRVSAQLAALQDGAEFTIDIAGQTLNGKAPNTGAWTKYQTVALGEVTINEPGTIAVTVRPNAAAWKAINLRFIELIPEN